MNRLYLWNNFTAFALGIVVMTASVVLFFRVPGGWFVSAPPGIHMPATPAPELKKETTEPLVVDFVQVYKPAVKKKLRLPAHVQADEKQHVVASTRTTNDERSHTVTTTLDSSTGEFTSYDRAEPHPWVAANTKTEIGLFYGLKDGERIARAQVQQELLQVKALHFGAVGSYDSDGSYFVGAGAWARF